MNCLNDEIIQMYIDGELVPAKIQAVEKHINNCSKCINKVPVRRKDATEFKKIINELGHEPEAIPSFKYANNNLKKPISITKRIAFALSAAAILAFSLLLIPSSNNYDKETMMLYKNDLNIDANKPITDQKFLIRIVDPEGNASEIEM